MSLLSQCRKPSGVLGRVVLWLMNRSHSRLTDWGLQHLSIQSGDVILDVGCGGGRTIQKLASLASAGKVYGVDHSEASVAAARETNRQGIDAGRIDIQQGSVSSLPFAGQMFDAVTAVETHYYWPDLTADLREVLRVLKPGGTLLLIAEAYRSGKYDKVFQKLEKVQKEMSFKLLSVDEHRELFSNAGYADVQVFEAYGKGWICVTGRRP